MIAKVYEKYTYTEIQKVKKQIQESKKETYYEESTRNERVYEPPTGVTKCLHCGDTLKDSMWVYSKSGKYLCPTCWYHRTTAYQRENYREQAQRMSSGGYSYKTVTDRIPKTKTVTFTKEIEVDEQVTKDGTKLVWPNDIAYNKKNDVLINTIPTFNNNMESHNLMTFQHINDDMIAEDISWYNAKSKIDVFEKILDKKKANEIEKVKIFNLGHIPYSEVIIDEKQVLEEFMDVVGFYPNVPAYIQGHPLNMYNNKRKNIVNIDKVITIYCNLTVDAKCDYGHYKNRGIILYSFIEHLMNHDYKVNLKLIDASFINGVTIIQEIETHVLKKLDLKDPEIYKLKDEQDKQLNYLYNILTTISFYRVILLESKAEFVRKNKLSSSWTDGYGYCLKNMDLRKALDIEEDIIVVGDPFEHKINGLFLDDDFENFIESIGITSDYEEHSTNVELKKSILTPKEVIESRKITKLIHVTANQNITSIKENGILPKTKLNAMNLEYHQNDFQRLDKHEDAICLSVSEPNDFLFKSFSQRNPMVTFSVIEIDPKILYKSDSKSTNIKKLYSDYNAASKYSKTSEVDMEIMFQDRIRRKAKTHTRAEKESYQPTSSQAEILYFSDIPAKYILKIYEHDFMEEVIYTKKLKTKTISEICREIGQITAHEVHNKLIRLGYLLPQKNGKKISYIPTDKGINAGIELQTRKSAIETYQVNVYNENAIKIIRDIMIPAEELE